MRKTLGLVLGLMLSLLAVVGMAGSASAAAPPVSQDGGTLSESLSERGAESLSPDGVTNHESFTASQTCSASGGAGFGFARITATQFEHGVSGTRQFRQIARGQIFNGARWVTVSQRTVVSQVFPNDFRSFRYGPIVNQFNFPGRYNGLLGRVQVRLDWLGTFGLTGTRTLNSCAAEV